MLHFLQYVTLRTRYSELMTLTSQYIKFITDTQRRLEDDEVITHSAAAGYCQKPKGPLKQTMPPTSPYLLTDSCMGNHLSLNTSKMLALQMVDSITQSPNLFSVIGQCALVKQTVSS